MGRKPKPAEWGKLAHLYDEINESFVDYDGQVRFLLACRDRFVPGGRWALDLGCGTGQHAWRLAGEGLRTVGVDLSRALLRQARKPRGNQGIVPDFVCGDLAALPVRAGFHLVYAMNFVLSFLHTNQTIRRVLTDVHRVLAPRGVFVADYHVFFPSTADDVLRRTWRERCRVRGQTLVVTHRPVVDWATQLSTDRVTHGFREGRRVVREVESVEVRRISLPQDLCCVLEASGFEVMEHCARFELGLPPDGRLGAIVASKA